MRRLALVVAALVVAITATGTPAGAQSPPPPAPDPAPAMEPGWQHIDYNTWTRRSAGACSFDVVIRGDHAHVVAANGGCSILTGARVYAAVGNQTGLRPPAGCNAANYLSQGQPAGCWAALGPPLQVKSVYWGGSAYAVKVNACPHNAACQDLYYTIF